MTDLWRRMHPSTRAYTCLSTTYRTMSRIDLAFASPELLKRVVDVEILSRGISDHAPVSVTIRLSRVEGVRLLRLSKYWIMDPGIQEEMPEALCAFWLRNEGSADPLVEWDAFKAWLRGDFTARVAVRKRESVQSLRDHEERARLKEAEFVRSPDSEHYVPWSDALRDLSLVRVDLTKKSMLESAQRVFEYGDKNGQLLACLLGGSDL